MKNTTVFVLCIFFLFSLITGQKRQLPKTPLSQEILDLLAMEISGQVIFNNEIILAGAP